MNNIRQYLGAKMDRGHLVLGLGVDGGSLRDQEPSNLLVTLLAGQVQGAEAGFALCIHLALVVKQRLGNVDLFLLGGSVNGRVAVLGHGVGMRPCPVAALQGSG